MKITNIKFCENPFNGNRADILPTGGHKEDNKRFSRLNERVSADVTFPVFITARRIVTKYKTLLLQILLSRFKLLIELQKNQLVLSCTKLFFGP